MPRLKWTPPALADVQRLHDFLKPKNPAAARRAVKAIRAGVKVLARQPHLGRPIEDMEPDYRDWPIDFGDSGYLVRYRADGKTVALLAVRHQKETGY